MKNGYTSKPKVSVFISMQSIFLSSGKELHRSGFLVGRSVGLSVCQKNLNLLNKGKFETIWKQMLSINISTLQSHYLGPFYSLNSLKISLERPKKLNRTLNKEHIMEKLRLCYKGNVIVIYRDSVEKSNLQNFIDRLSW